MDQEFNQSGGKGTLSLSGDLMIEDASELKDALARALADVTTLEVDMAGVESADVACLQVFCSAHRTALRQGGTLLFRNVGQGFIGILETSGFLRHMGCSPDRDDCLWLGEKR